MRNGKWAAALALSMLVYPGTGHLLFKLWRRGLMWVICFSFVMVSAMAMMGSSLATVSEQLMSPTGEVQFDVQQMGTAALLGLATIVMWALAALDTWVVSRKLKAAEPAADPGFTRENPPTGNSLPEL